jgi:hypothetical protein
MQRIAATAALDWLRGLPPRGVGFDPTGWEAETWILHAMYERADVPGGLTHDDVRRIEVAAGTQEPVIINNVNLEELGVVVGNLLGRSGHPGPGWSRLRWDELARRLDTNIFADWHLPCYRSFPYRSWPANIEPPAEGSLDREQLERLLVHLCDHATGGSRQDCRAFYPGWIAAEDPAEDVVYELRLEELMDLYGDAAVPGSPINLWPTDTSWFVLTDWDLWGTKVSGSRELVAAVADDPAIETTSVPSAPPAASG